MKFSIWLEARKQKNQLGQGSLFDLLDEPSQQQTMQTPEPEPEEESPTFTYGEPTSQPRQFDPNRRKAPPGSMSAPIRVKISDLLKKSGNNREKFFVIHSYGRTIDVKDLHKWGSPESTGQSRIVGYDDKGHRYLVARNPEDAVLYYPQGKMKSRIGI